MSLFFPSRPAILLMTYSMAGGVGMIAVGVFGAMSQETRLSPNDFKIKLLLGTQVRDPWLCHILD